MFGAIRHLLDSLLDHGLRRIYLGRDVEPQQLQDIEQHQLRRPMRPINTPMATAPANAPKGFRRAMFSTSVAKVLPDRWPK
jgi:hypothetical protein